MDILQAQEVKKQVFTKYFPQVQLSGLGYFAASPVVQFGIEDVQSGDMRELLQDIYDAFSSSGSDIQNELTLMKKGVSSSVVAAQPIYAGGRIVTGNKLAKLGVEAAELQSESRTVGILPAEIMFQKCVAKGLLRNGFAVQSTLEMKCLCRRFVADLDQQFVVKH